MTLWILVRKGQHLPFANNQEQDAVELLTENKQNISLYVLTSNKIIRTEIYQNSGYGYTSAQYHKTNIIRLYMYSGNVS